MIAASVALLAALGCGLLGLAAQQGLVTPRNITIQAGPLIFIGRGPRSLACLQSRDPFASLCGQRSFASQPARYRMWLFWHVPGRGLQSTSILAQFSLPLRETGRGQGRFAQ